MGKTLARGTHEGTDLRIQRSSLFVHVHWLPSERAEPSLLEKGPSSPQGPCGPLRGPLSLAAPHGGPFGMSVGAVGRRGRAAWLGGRGSVGRRGPSCVFVRGVRSGSGPKFDYSDHVRSCQNKPKHAQISQFPKR